METDDSNNGPHGRGRLMRYQTDKDKSPTWVKGPSRKRQPESLVEALTGRITRADESECLHNERRHYTWLGSKPGGLITFAENQSLLSKTNKSKPQLKGSKQREIETIHAIIL